MKTGTVKWFTLQKGYGFIHPDDGSPNIFVHISAVQSAGLSDLKQGQRVIFEIQRDKRTGSESAVSLAPLEFESFRHDRQSSEPGATDELRLSAAVSRPPIRLTSSPRRYPRHCGHARGSEAARQVTAA